MRSPINRMIGVLAAACSLVAAPEPGASDPPAASRESPLVFRGVNVVPMTSDAVLSARDVLVRNGTVESIVPAGTLAIPMGAVVVEGGGRYLMPALIDMHVHSNAADLAAYLRNGIGTVRDMWGHRAVVRLAGEIAAGTRVGPTIIAASPGVDGPPAQWPETILLTSPDSAAIVVSRLKSEGFSYLKLYTRLRADVFEALVAAAGATGMKPIGHVPMAVDIHRALELGMHSIEHLTGYDIAASPNRRGGTWGWAEADVSRLPALAYETRVAGTWNCPTLAIYMELAKQHTAAERARMIANRRLFVRMLSDSGARLIAGTDAGINVVAPGVSLHDELQEFVAAGLSPYKALRAATVDAAEFLDRPDLGVVREGARADLLLLDANPLADISNTRRISGVVLNGAWRPAREL